MLLARELKKEITAASTQLYILCTFTTGSDSRRVPGDQDWPCSWQRTGARNRQGYLPPPRHQPPTNPHLRQGPGLCGPSHLPRQSDRGTVQWVNECSVLLQVTSTETLQTIRDGEPRTYTSTLSQLLSSEWLKLWTPSLEHTAANQIQVCNHLSTLQPIKASQLIVHRAKFLKTGRHVFIIGYGTKWKTINLTALVQRAAIA